MQLYSIRIPAKSHIAKFAHIRYGDPVLINNATALAALIRGLLHKPNFNSQYTSGKENLRLKYLNAQIHCAAPLSNMAHIGYALTADHIIQINAFLEEDFKERLQLFVAKTANWEHRRAGIDQAVEAFAHHYGIIIDQDITLDGLKKIEYRARTQATSRHPNRVNLLATSQIIIL
jgi:hypothetical protein